MRTRVSVSLSLLILLVGCVPGAVPTPTAISTKLSPAPTVIAATLSPSPWPSVTPWPTRPTSRPTPIPPSPTSLWPTPTPCPTRTPCPECPPFEWGEVDPASFFPVGTLFQEEFFQEYTVRAYSEWPCGHRGAFEILHGGLRIYAHTGDGRLSIGRFHERKRGERLIPIGTDITGDGTPDLLIHQCVCGVHCCSSFHLFELGEEFRYLGMIGAMDYLAIEVADLDGDGNWEFVTEDQTFRNHGPGNWGECCGPAPYVIRHYEEGAFPLVADLMRQPAPTLAELEAAALPYREAADLINLSYEYSYEFWQESSEISHEFWLDLLGFLYTGHAELVETFLGIVWPDDERIRIAALEVLLKTQSHSPYWAEIKALSAEWPWPEY